MKRAIVNVQSIDNACFAWSVIAALHAAEKKFERKTSYPDYTTVLNLKGIVFPTLNQKFKNLNDISINVYCTEKQKELSILPILLTDTKREKHVNLLYMQDGNEEHFAWIKNLSRLISSQLSKKEHKKFFCNRYVFTKIMKYFDVFIFMVQ